MYRLLAGLVGAVAVYLVGRALARACLPARVDVATGRQPDLPQMFDNLTGAEWPDIPTLGAEFNAEAFR